MNSRINYIGQLSCPLPKNHAPSMTFLGRLRLKICPFVRSKVIFDPISDLFLELLFDLCQKKRLEVETLGLGRHRWPSGKFDSSEILAESFGTLCTNDGTRHCVRLRPARTFGGLLF